MSYTRETYEMNIYGTMKYYDIFWALLKNTVLMKDSVAQLALKIILEQDVKDPVLFGPSLELDFFE